jgi:hypothetical protein
VSWERQGNFCLSHRNENEETFYNQKHLPLAALFHNSSVALKPIKKEEGTSEGLLHEKQHERQKKKVLQRRL